MNESGYRKLEIYQEAHQLAIEIHKTTLHLPKNEMYEEGSQIRRSSKSTVNQIVEGYCLRQYKNDFLLYLNRAFASNEETLEHLTLLFETESLKDEKLFRKLRSDIDILGKKIFRFIQSVIESHQKPSYVKEETVNYSSGTNPTSHISNQDLTSHIPHQENE